MEVTPGDKTFLWRAYQEALPTQSNLFKKKIVSDPICSICNREEESVQHVLWSCEVAKDVWSQCSKKLQKCSISSYSMIQLFDTLTKALNPEELQDAITKPPPVVSWQAPPVDWFKINWDGAADKAKGLIGIGVVIRDSSGQVITTMRQRIKLYPNPLLAESYGALQAVKVA
ncbi:uncharacterized protein LOC121235382 [Juglans microcarpa x Juglans regia]|uniref:uncharacterized protein LOC121235382 n=1 Tax=Juglans microcarpa x Juglans regia TaxID=2249226 RepID=UPI001B7EF2F0|nr:uncharacterized protein LOC121235382 [Juglans microcarpa x Juglans regia]